MKPVKRTREGHQLSFHEGEPQLLRGLVTSYMEVIAPVVPPGEDSADLGARMSAGAVDREVIDADPALNRLFPAAYADSADAAEYRRFTESEAARTKLAEAAVVLDDLDGATQTLLITPERYLQWLRTITAVRLVIHERDAGELSDLQDWLGWLLESLLAD